MVVKDAFKESCSRYPEAVPALVFFATAAGLFETALTMEHINWAREAMIKNGIAPVAHEYTTANSKIL